MKMEARITSIKLTGLKVMCTTSWLLKLMCMLTPALEKFKGAFPA